LLLIKKKTGENMRPNKIIFLIFSSIIPLLLTNCSPSQNAILNLKPQTENSEWYKGKEIATLDNDSIVITISFDKVFNNDYMFDVDIINYSDKKMLVEPEKFSYKMISGSIKRGENVAAVTAKDPEKVILELQKLQLIHQNNMETQAMVYSLGYFLQFAGQTKASVTDDIELSRQIDHQAQRMKEDELIDDIQNNNISNSLDKSSYIWEMLALRKTTLYQNESISGKVFFPVNELAKTLEFTFLIDEQSVKILYNQEVIPLYKKYVDPNLYY